MPSTEAQTALLTLSSADGTRSSKLNYRAMCLLNKIPRGVHVPQSLMRLIHSTDNSRYAYKMSSCVIKSKIRLPNLSKKLCKYPGNPVLCAVTARCLSAYTSREGTWILFTLITIISKD